MKFTSHYGLCIQRWVKVKARLAQNGLYRCTASPPSIVVVVVVVREIRPKKTLRGGRSHLSSHGNRLAYDNARYISAVRFLSAKTRPTARARAHCIDRKIRSSVVARRSATECAGNACMQKRTSRWTIRDCRHMSATWWFAHGLMRGTVDKPNGNLRFRVS